MVSRVGSTEPSKSINTRLASPRRRAVRPVATAIDTTHRQAARGANHTVYDNLHHTLVAPDNLGWGVSESKGQQRAGARAGALRRGGAGSSILSARCFMLFTLSHSRSIPYQPVRKAVVVADGVL